MYDAVQALVSTIIREAGYIVRIPAVSHDHPVLEAWDGQTIIAMIEVREEFVHLAFGRIVPYSDPHFRETLLAAMIACHEECTNLVDRLLSDTRLRKRLLNAS